MFAQESVMAINKEREDFEAEFSKIKSDIAFWLHTWDEEMQGYNHPVMCWFWYMWQAARVESHKQAALYQFEINHLAQANQQWREKAAKAQAVLKSPVMAFDEWFKKRHEKTGLYEEALCGKDDATYIKHEMNKAFQAGWKKKQAVPEGFVLVPKAGAQYFSHDFIGDGFKYHDTLDEAKKEAEASLDWYRDQVADGMHVNDMGEFNELSYGLVVGSAEYSIDHVVTQGDIDKGEYSYEVGTEILSLYLSEAQEQSHD